MEAGDESQGGPPSDQNSSLEADIDIEKSSDLDVEAEKEKAKSRWDEPEDVNPVNRQPALPEGSPGSSPRPLTPRTPTLTSSPRSCPPTPEAVPQGLRTPPPSTSRGQAR